MRAKIAITISLLCIGAMLFFVGYNIGYKKGIPKTQKIETHIIYKETPGICFCSEAINTGLRKVGNSWVFSVSGKDMLRVDCNPVRISQ